MAAEVVSTGPKEQMKGMKVLFVLPDVCIGGIERVRLTLIEQFTADGIDCRLALRRCRGELISRACALAPVDELAPRGILQFVPALAKLIRREQPTHLISAFSDVGLLVWTALRLARSSANWVHTVDNTHDMVGRRPGVWGRLRYSGENWIAGFVYRTADAVVAVSEGVENEVRQHYRIEPMRLIKIWNPVVPTAELTARVSRSTNRDMMSCSIVSVGRLVRQKGIDVLIQAMSGVHGSWRLDIWGEGPERTSLESIISASSMRDRIRLRGYAADPYEVMRQADLFVLPSRHEGLGNALVEALACQCQVVATDCPHGPREVLEDGKLGQLVPTNDPQALADAINRAVSGAHYVDPCLLLERAKAFSVDASCSQWESLLRAL